MATLPLPLSMDRTPSTVVGKLDPGSMSLSLVLDKLGFTTWPGKFGCKSILRNGVVVFVGTAGEVWSWLRAADLIVTRPDDEKPNYNDAQLALIRDSLAANQLLDICALQDLEWPDDHAQPDPYDYANDR